VEPAIFALRCAYLGEADAGRTMEEEHRHLRPLLPAPVPPPAPPPPVAKAEKARQAVPAPRGEICPTCGLNAYRFGESVWSGSSVDVSRSLRPEAISEWRSWKAIRRSVHNGRLRWTAGGWRGMTLSTTLRYVLGLLECNKPQGGYHMYCICMGVMAFCCILQSPNPEKTTKTNGQVKW
jgi:hypothetical protein